MASASGGNDGRRKFYRENLADLVLTEDANKHLFMAAPQLYAVVLDVSSLVWERHVRDPFRSLKGAYERWLAIARGAIGAWIREE